MEVLALNRVTTTMFQE